MCFEKKKSCPANQRLCEHRFKYILQLRKIILKKENNLFNILLYKNKTYLSKKKKKTKLKENKRTLDDKKKMHRQSWQKKTHRQININAFLEAFCVFICRTIFAFIHLFVIPIV